MDLELRDVVAIHRLRSDRPGERPIIVRLFNSDAKRNVMPAKKNLKNNVRFVDDITKQNHELMKRMRDTNRYSTIVAYMEEHLMINNSNLICMTTLTLKSDREGKCLLFYHTLTVHIYLTLYLICLYLL